MLIQNHAFMYVVDERTKEEQADRSTRVLPLNTRFNFSTRLVH